MKKIKKTLALMLVCMLAVSMCGINAFADYTVNITISDGSLKLVNEQFTVGDNDSDGVITINDALIAAHATAFPNGDGFASENTDYGLSMTKLWGIENGGSYGYYINNTSAMSLLDPIAEGDYIAAFVYTDLTTWSDTYCYFDKNSISANANDEILLILNSAGYDENWNPIIVPVVGAEISLDGIATGIKTDKNGNAVIKISQIGTHTISAKSDTTILVPPAAIVDITEKAPQTADCMLSYGIGTLLLGALAAVCLKKFSVR